MTTFFISRHPGAFEWAVRRGLRIDRRVVHLDLAEVSLGGAVGEWTLRADLPPALPLLWLGQWLHAGKNASMGMGGYTLRLN